MAKQHSDIQPAAFRFPLVDVSGKSLRDPSLWGSLGFRDYYDGSLSDSDALIQAIRAVHLSKPISVKQSRVLRSFCLAWLSSCTKHLSAVIDYAVPLADSVGFITRIGLIDRTVKKVAVGTAGLAASVLFLEMAWESATVDLGEMSALESGTHLIHQIERDIELDQRLQDVFAALDKNLGEVGEPTARADFCPDVLFDFLKLCHFRSVLVHANFDTDVLAQLLTKLDVRIFSLFLANSRQIEGLAICGASEATAGIVAHAALALGLHDQEGNADTIEQIEMRIASLHNPERQREATQTLDSIKRNLTGKAEQLQLSLTRHLSSSTATEAIDWATFPMTSSLELFATIADGLAQFAGTSKVGGFLKTARDSLNEVSSFVDLTPDAASHVINSGVSVEQWTRKLVDKFRTHDS